MYNEIEIMNSRIRSVKDRDKWPNIYLLHQNTRQGYTRLALRKLFKKKKKKPKKH